ncbi:unnamed protein product [Cuscuta campestris]|uniref:RNase H type-1 domain-containing protein n=1 Tax=Cuscuta campestris TaxID=132261 RepID=A0A484MYD9_9ASTE|nr:unnamed protein product [Cuscuta campestris]
MQAHQPPPRLKNTADPNLPWLMGLRAPKEYACPLSTSPYYLPRKMREEVNLEEISMDFDDWVYNSPNKDLWSFAFMKDWKFGFLSCLGRAFSLSSYYKEGLRAIFGHVYTETVVGGRYRPKLGTLIRQCNGVISIDTSNSSTEPVNSSNILETIDTLVMLVKHVIDFVPLDKPSAYPDEVTRFFELCRLPRCKSDLEIQSQQINATSAQVQATNEGASIPVAATIPVISAPVLPLGLSSIPTASVISPFATPVPSAGPRVTFPPSMAQFMNDPANLQAIQGFGAGTMPLQSPMAVTSFQTPMPQPSPFQSELVSTMAPVNLTGALNAAGPSRPPQATNPQITPDGHCVSIESDDGEWDIPRAHKKKKGKNIRPAASRNSAFERLGDREEGQRKSAKQRLGQSVAHEPARTRASHQEEEAESQPRLPVANRLTIPNDCVQQMEAKLERLEKKVGEKNDRDKPLAGSPFTTRVHLTPFPRKVKIDAPRFTGKEDPEIHLDSFNQSATMNGCTDEEKCLLFFQTLRNRATEWVHLTPFPRKVKIDAPRFTGKEDPEIHLDSFNQSATMNGCTDEEKCLLFFQTLRNRATEWFNKLRPGSIDSFNDLASKFKAKFQENCTKRKKFTYLSTAGQRESENLTQFLTRWKEEVDKVEEMDDKTVLSLLLNGLRAGELYKEFCRRPPATYQEAYHTAWEFAEAETQLRAKREAEHGHKPKPVQVKKEEAPGPSRPRHHYDPVIRVVNTEECQEVRKAPDIPPENPTGQVGQQWSGTYCSYHRSDSHNTSECKSVKGVIRQMIDNGELGKDYLQKAQEKSHQWVRPTAPGDDRDNDRRRNNRPRERQPAPGKEHIGMIFGRPKGGDSAAQRKNWVWSIYVGEVSAEPPRRKHTRREPIVFTDRDLPPTGEYHNDPLVITRDINGVDVARVLVATGSSVNILYLETFQKLRLCRTQLEPLKTPLSGFTGDTVEAEGSIVLPVKLGSGEKTVWKKMRFIVVDIKCVHNAILGRPGINRVEAVISMPHLCMKFHTPGGVGEVKGDQRNARECYARAVKKMTKGVNVISQEITKGETREKLEPEAETVEIELHPGDSSRMVRIGANLPEDLKVEITRVLQEYAGIFAWSVADMPGIDRSVICHRLAVREGSRPVQQKKRYLASDRREFVKKEVKDLLSVDLPVNKPAEQWWEMTVDGASGPRGYGGGIVFTTPEGFKIYHAIVFNFKVTNNEAEYEALAGGLRLAQALKISRVSIKSDSSLIVGQVTGNMEAREGRMAQYKDLVLALLKGFEEFKIAQIPRAENADADLLSKLTQYAPEHVSKLARVEILDRASIEKLEVAAIAAGSQSDRSNLVGADDHWMYDLMEYLMDGSLPEQDDRARKGKLRAPRFQVLDGKLYKRAFGGPLLRCPTNREAERVIAEVHEGVCAAHQMSRTLSQRIILLGYYWPTIVQDCERLPIEAEFPTFRESSYQPQQNEEDQLAELNLVEERKMAAEVKMSTYQQVVKKYHDNKVGPRYFQVGDEVLRRREASRPAMEESWQKTGKAHTGLEPSFDWERID